MAQNAATLMPRDPLRIYRFRLWLPLDGGAPGDEFASPPGYIAGVRSVSGLSMTVKPFEIYEGGNNLHRYAQPDKVTWDPITLEQGLGIGSKLTDWAQAVRDFCVGSISSTGPVKRNVNLGVFDEADGLRMLFEIKNAWISKFQATPKLDAMATSEVGIQTLELTHEGWTLAPSPITAPDHT
jgi:phage tail-like protein